MKTIILKNGKKLKPIGIRVTFGFIMPGYLFVAMEREVLHDYIKDSILEMSEVEDIVYKFQPSGDEGDYLIYGKLTVLPEAECLDWEDPTSAKTASPLLAADKPAKSANPFNLGS